MLMHWNFELEVKNYFETASYFKSPSEGKSSRITNRASDKNSQFRNFKFLEDLILILNENLVER